MHAALNANRALANHLQLIKEHIESSHHGNGIQAVSLISFYACEAGTEQIEQ